MVGCRSAPKSPPNPPAHAANPPCPSKRPRKRPSTSTWMTSAKFSKPPSMNPTDALPCYDPRESRFAVRHL
uniref:Uncharacterized protein n=1 Tax=Panagrellus redivivus TaxID=6233 RepID=A0A7E4VER7_PANRE